MSKANTIVLMMSDIIPLLNTAEYKAKVALKQPNRKDFNVNYESEMDTQEYQVHIKLTREMLAELISNRAKLNG